MAGELSGYITCRDSLEAEQLAANLMENRLIACANIMPTMKSIYRWQGRIERQNEIALIVKTTENQKNRVMDAILKHHSYETPCILFTKIVDGNPNYLEWIREQVY